jgi:hypothetical protein
MLLAAALILYAGRGLTFIYDEWSVILERRDWNADAFLLPHNEHLILVTVAIFKVLFVGVGLDDYWVYRAVGIGFHLACVALLFQVASRRVSQFAAAAVCLPLLFMGSAYEVLLAPMQIHVLASVAAGLGMLVMLDRCDRRGDFLAALLLAASIATSTFGLPFAVAFAVESMLPRPRLRRVVLVLIPLAVYGVWYAKYGSAAVVGGGALTENLRGVPAFALEAAAGTLGELAGGPATIGWLLLVLCVFFGFPTRWRSVSVRFVSLLLTALAYWSLIGVGRAHLQAPTASRYLYVGALLVLLMLVERMRGIDVRRATSVAIAGAVGISVAGNLVDLFRAGRFLRDTSSYVAAELGALELAGPSVAASFRPDPIRAPPVYSASYFDAVAELGSPADEPEELAARPEPVRRASDDVLIEALDISPRRSARRLPGSTPPRVERASQVPVEIEASCARFAVPGPGRAIELEISTPRIAVTAPDARVAMSLRRFADGFSGRVATLRGRNLVVGLPLGGYSGRWHVRFEAVERGRVDVCGAGPP